MSVRPPSVYMQRSPNSAMSMKMSQSMHGLARCEDDDQIEHEYQTEPRRRSTMRLGTTAISNDFYTPPTQDSWSQKKRPIQMGVSGMLKKSYSAYGIAAACNEDSDSTYSHGRSLKIKSKKPANFLRNLFSANDPRTNKKSSKPEPIKQPRTITQSDYFMPKNLSNISDPSYWSKPSSSLDHNHSGCDWATDCETCNPSKKPDHQDYHQLSSPEQKPKRPVERLLSSSLVGHRLKKAFRKEKAGSEWWNRSKDDMLFGGQVNEPNHQVLRRQNTDLCAGRLANFQPSTANTAFPRPRQQTDMPEHRRFHTAPIVPPHAGRMSNNAMQNCIDELRRKRSANGSTSSSTKTESSRDEEIENVNRQTDRPNIVRMRVHERPTQSVNERNMSSRMSVPNLSASDLTSSNKINDEQRVQKMGRAPGTGELQTINEGLITPVVRRKFTNRQVVKTPPDSSFSGDDLKSYLPKHSRTASAEQQTTTQTQRQLAESLAAELSNLASKSNNKQQKVDPPSIYGPQNSLLRARSAKSVSTSNGTQIKPKEGEIPTFVHKIQPPTWSAVNRELKTRQQLQVAKVKPQPVARTRQPATIGQKSIPDTGRITIRPMSKMAMNGNELKSESESETLEQSGLLDTTDTSNSIQISSFDDSKNDQEDDDVVSIAGTVFNEPWDSNVLENLFDIAQYCDERPSKSKTKAAFMECCTQETIAEEEENRSFCGSTSTASISPYSTRNDPSPTHNSNSDVEVRQESLSPEDKLQDELVYERPCSSELTTNDVLNLANNKIWSDISKRIPSEPSTFDSRKDMKSRSMLNVTSAHMMSPVVERQNFKLRAQTPGVFNHTSNFNDSLNDFHNILPASSPARLRTKDRTDPGQRIQNHIEKLAIDSNSTFGASLQVFIECTVDSQTLDPRLVIRRARQFITGIKNYLTNSETIQELIEEQSARLRENEFLNIDSILESILEKIVLLPIKRHVYHLFCRESIKNGSLETLTSNFSLVRNLSMEKLGFQLTTKAPDLKTMDVARKYMRKMQNHYSPLKKFENLLNALSLLIRPNCSSTLLRSDSSKKLPCSDVIRWFVFLLAKTSFVTCEIEACYMFELLPQQLLTAGDVVYYLACLFSAIHILKNSDSIQRLGLMTERMPVFQSAQESLNSCINECRDGYFRVAIPNEHCGNIEYMLCPLVAQLNTQRLCQIISTQFSISNENYGLFVLYDGYETCLHANECPLTVRQELTASGKSHFFAYKRAESRIAWPATAVQLTSSTSLNQPIQAATFGSAQTRYI